MMTSVGIFQCLWGEIKSQERSHGESQFCLGIQKIKSHNNVIKKYQRFGPVYVILYV